MKNFKWDKKYLYWGVTAFCVVVASIAFFWVLTSWSVVHAGISIVMSALSPIIYGLLIAYLLNKILVVFEERVFSKLAKRLFKKPDTARKAARMISIAVTLILALGFIAGIMAIILPEIYNSVMKIISNSGDYLNSAIGWLERVFNGYELEQVAVEWVNTISGKVVEWLENNVLPQISTLITNVTGGVISVVGTIINLFVGVIISIYVMYNKETFCAQAKKFIYSLLRTRTANGLMAEMDFINDAFGNYITGTLIDALIVGVVNYIFMTIVGIPYTALVSLIVGITNLIPVFGPFIGAVPSALLILLENPSKCLIFIIFTVVLQQIDGQIIKPKIHSSRTGLSGFWIMFAILFFGGLFGIVGMVIGVPLTTVLYSIIRRLNNRRLRRRGLPEETEFYAGLESLDPSTKEPSYKPGRVVPGAEPESQEETACEEPETPGEDRAEGGESGGGEEKP